MSLVYRDSWRIEQQIFEIHGVRLGGFPGLNSTLLVASILYHGDKYLLSKDGTIDKEGLRKAVNEAMDIAEEHGLKLGLDVIFPSIESVEKIMEFVSEFETILFLDSPEPSVRMKAYMVAKELGVTGKCIANGIYVNTSSEEIDALHESGIESAVLLAFDPANPLFSIKPENRMKIIKEILLPLAKKAGVKKVLVDAIVIDPASIALSAETIYLVKKELGLPAGCAPANALGVVSKKTVGETGMYSIHGTTATFLRLYGADFIMYGPIKRIKYVAPAVALVDSLLAYIARHYGEKIPSTHPLRKFFKNIQKLFTQASQG